MFSVAIDIVIQPRMELVSMPSAPVDRIARVLTAAAGAYLLVRVGMGLLSI